MMQVRNSKGRRRELKGWTGLSETENGQDWMAAPPKGLRPGRGRWALGPRGEDPGPGAEMGAGLCLFSFSRPSGSSDYISSAFFRREDQRRLIRWQHILKP